MSRSTRRDFLKAGLAATTLAGGSKFAWAQKRSATDWVTLGNSGIKVTRIAFGTGTMGGSMHRGMGQEQFTRLVRYAYDKGIRFFETAESYRGMPEMLAIALKGLPRDSYKLMTKYSVSGTEKPSEKIDRLRSQLDTDHLDIMLMHCLRSPNWHEETKPVQDALSEAKVKKTVLAHGASVHGLQALAGFPGYKWLDVALMRMNHAGVRMDSMDLRDTDTLGDVNQVVAQSKKIHDQGTGILGMKLIGEGRFTDPDQREKSMRFVMNLGTVDAVTIGFKSPAEIDEAIERMNRILNS